MTKEDQKKTYFGNPNMPTFCFSMYVRVGTLGSAVFLLSLFPFSVLGDWGDGELFAVSEAGIDDIDFCGGGNWLAIAGRNPCLILRTDNYAIAKKVKGEVTSATCVRTSADGLSIVHVHCSGRSFVGAG